MKPVIKVSALIAAILLVCVLLIPFMKVPANAMTQTIMMGTEKRIRAYVAQQQKLPSRLSELPPEDEKYYSSLNDGWGRELIYSPQPDGSVVLMSYGKSGKPGSPDSMTLRFKVGKPEWGIVEVGSSGTAAGEER